MPKYDDFNLDIQNTASQDAEPILKSCWGCQSKYIPCIETEYCQKN